MARKKKPMTHPNAKISDEEFVKSINPDAHERIEGGRVGIFVGIDQSINSGRYIGGGYSSAEAWANAKANVETDIRLRAEEGIGAAIPEPVVGPQLNTTTDNLRTNQYEIYEAMICDVCQQTLVWSKGSTVSDCRHHVRLGKSSARISDNLQRDRR